MIQSYYPLQSLRASHWFKLICGASFQHLPAVRNLVLAYTLAGADCVDVAADPAVIAVAKEALTTAAQLRGEAVRRGYNSQGLPWLMVSLNDGEDPHFRKAEFVAEFCPSDCPRPCEQICPAEAINAQGVISDRCYGCGRCLPICPVQHITTRSYVATPGSITPLLMEYGIDAIEIHTQVGRLADFTRLWATIRPWVNQLQLVAVSCPDGDDLIDYLWAIHDLITPLPCALVWQTDGRPMSGDIGVGATRAAVKLGQKVLAARLPGYVQLAGGTNHYTTTKLRAIGLLPQPSERHPEDLPFRISGVAYGSYARTLLNPVLEQLEMGLAAAGIVSTPSPQRVSVTDLNSTDAPPFTSQSASAPLPQIAPPIHLESAPELLWQAVDLAYSLVSQVKSPVYASTTAASPER